MVTRLCTKCYKEKPLDKYRLYQSGRRRRRECMVCEKRRKRARKNSPERCEQMRRARFLREYGITVEEYDEMVEERDGLCDICGQLPKDNRGSKLVPDHVKGTKILRGLLCLTCNVGIGMLKHDLLVVRNAYRYLKKAS